MKGSTKDLLQIQGVQGFVLTDGRNVQVKLPSTHPLSGAKERFKRLHQELGRKGARPGNTVEILLDNVLITLFFSGSTMLAVLASPDVNQALLRITGRLIIAGSPG
ncbi:MAG TPA: hypothetical protein PLS81_08310 [Deltaproteobacteria bacterium]|nr:hypothetical protein [Deltaproteobacteria bacterium]HOM29447.1 hypothetical protein [Deltaproteobacteria bacterium]HPP80100.1 hypothetical protein [Deltaproteobacteria bacterium]